MKRSKRLQMKKKARAFYRKRAAAKAEKAAGDALPRDEAEALRPWRGCGLVMAALAALALAGWTLSRFF